MKLLRRLFAVVKRWLSGFWSNSTYVIQKTSYRISPLSAGPGEENDMSPSWTLEDDGTLDTVVSWHDLETGDQAAADTFDQRERFEQSRTGEGRPGHRRRDGGLRGQPCLLWRFLRSRTNRARCDASSATRRVVGTDEVGAHKNQHDRKPEDATHRFTSVVEWTTPATPFSQIQLPCPVRGDCAAWIVMERRCG